MTRRRRATVWCGLLLMLSIAATLQSQTQTATLSGRITDQQGKAVPGAVVEVINTDTGTTVRSQSDAAGLYVISYLAPGHYRIVIQKPGFKEIVKAGLTLHVQDVIAQNFTLAVGSLAQSIQVTGATPLLQTETASMGQVVGTTQVNDLPLNGRNFTFLAQLAAGVTVAQQDSRGLSLSGTFAANGMRPGMNNYLLNGMDNNNQLSALKNGTAYVVLPPVDAIQEFKVQTADFSAEFGRAGAAVLNATLKSGTNQFHGDAWEFLRNDAFDAADFFVNAARERIGEYRQNQFGFTLGGPIRKNKMFFFVDYQGTRTRQGVPYVSTVPTAVERESGYKDFADLISNQKGTRTDLLGRTFPLGTIFDPASTRPVTKGQVDPSTGRAATGTGYVRDPFPGNILPSSRVDPSAIKLLGLLPLPNSPGVINNYTSVPRRTNNQNSFDMRIDEGFSDRDQMFASYSFSQQDQFLPGPFSGLADGSPNTLPGNTRTQVATLSETHIFSPSVVNEVSVGFNRIHNSTLQSFGNDLTNIPLQYGIPGIPQVPENGGLPQFMVGSLTTFGQPAFNPSNKLGQTIQVTENLTKLAGPHSLKGGFEFQHMNFPTLAPAETRGIFTFKGAYTSVVNQRDPSVAIAQLLLVPAPATVQGGVNNVGGMDSLTASSFAPYSDFSRNYFGAYFQDDWKIAPKLALNLGLRWEFFGYPQENFGALANFVPGAPFNGATYLVPAGRAKDVPHSFTNALAKDGIRFEPTTKYGLNLVKSQYSNFAPRFGFAYHLARKLVIRGGYGLYYGGFDEVEGLSALPEANFPFNVVSNFPAPNAAAPITLDNSIGLLENGLLKVPLSPSEAKVSGLQLFGVQFNWKTAYTQSYNFTLQYELGPQSSLELAYVGTQARHLQTISASNQVTELLPPTVNPQLYVPFPDFARDASYNAAQGNSNYNALEANVDKRYSSGLDLLANYTYSRCRTDARDILSNDIGGYRGANIAGFGIQPDYALCDFDVRNIVHLSGGYELPFGRRKHFLGNRRGLVNALAGGWKTYWILTLQDGQPFTIPCTTTTAADAGCNALLVPGQNPIGGPHNVDQWMNPAAFADPPAVTAIGENSFAPLGGAPTQVVGPGFHRLDFSLFKEFNTSERTRLEFRAEVFNLTNTPNFALPSVRNFTNPATFGKIIATRDNPNDPREIQLALKFYW